MRVRGKLNVRPLFVPPLHTGCDNQANPCLSAFTAHALYPVQPFIVGNTNVAQTPLPDGNKKRIRIC